MLLHILTRTTMMMIRILTSIFVLQETPGLLLVSTKTSPENFSLLTVVCFGNPGMQKNKLKKKNFEDAIFPCVLLEEGRRNSDNVSMKISYIKELQDDTVISCSKSAILWRMSGVRVFNIFVCVIYNFLKWKRDVVNDGRITFWFYQPMDELLCRLHCAAS